MAATAIGCSANGRSEPCTDQAAEALEADRAVAQVAVDLVEALVAEARADKQAVLLPRLLVWEAVGEAGETGAAGAAVVAAVVAAVAAGASFRFSRSSPWS